MHFDLVILATADDPHVKSVLDHLNKFGITYAGLDRGSLYGQELTFRPDIRRLTVGSFDISSCSLVWYRRAMPTTIPDIDPSYRRFVDNEFSHSFFGGLQAICERWFNSPYAIQRASYKSDQLRLAAQDGRLTIPRSLITSSFDDLQEFLSVEHAGGYVVKSLYRPFIESDGRIGVIYTSKIDDAVRKNLSDIKTSPCIVQEFVDRAYDVRVNVIGDDIFGTRMDSSHIPEAYTDWRMARDFRDIRHSAIQLPADIAAACLDMCNHFGLRFGAFDFAVDRDGQWFFLELNPNGQWYWIEEITEQPLSQAMAREIRRELSQT
jgi:glutathione synthase/RimK-type ligase-like ATP-grasp enzyme